MSDGDLELIARTETDDPGEGPPPLAGRRAAADVAVPTSLSSILSAMHEGVAVFDRRGRCLVFSARMAAITGLARAEAGAPGLLRRLVPDRARRAEALACGARAWRGEELGARAITIVRADGPRDLLVSMSVFEDLGARRLLVTARDISEQRRAEQARWALERRQREAERLESLAAMAGGVAHDFNNLLQTMLGFTELAAAQLPADAAAAAALAQVEAAVRRASELTRKMLAYAGRARLVPRSLDVSRLVGRTRPLLAGSLTGGQWLDVELAADLPRVDGDPTQLRQLLIDLVANASEALLERGGRVVVRTGTIVCDEGYLEGCHAGHGLRGGAYVYLEVEDSGCGLGEAARARLFDPFYSTKFTGRGLGLAAVLGVVRGHRGAIDVRSALGVGTRVRVLLPVAPDLS